MDDGDDWEEVAITVVANAPTTLSSQPFDVVEALANQMAARFPGQQGIKALVSLSTTCCTLRQQINSVATWDFLSRRHFAFFAPMRVDVRVGFPCPLGGPETDLSEIQLVSNLCSGAVDAAAARDLIASSVAWCIGKVRREGRCAFSRPTVGPLSEAPALGGGLPTFVGLEGARTLLLNKLRVREEDISLLPDVVDMIVVPSNQWLMNPGFGVIDAIYAQAGAELETWLEHKRNAHRSAGERELLSEGGTLVSPAFGRVNASFLCHACGVQFYEASLFQTSVQQAQLYEQIARSAIDTSMPGSLPAPEASQPDVDAEPDGPEGLLSRAAGEQLALLRRIFSDAAACGATSIAIPSVSAGKRCFPPMLAAAITCAVAASEVLASGGSLSVHLVIWGDERHKAAFAWAREEAARKLVPL